MPLQPQSVTFDLIVRNRGMNTIKNFVIGGIIILFVIFLGIFFNNRVVNNRATDTRSGYYTVYGYIFDAGLEFSDTDFITAKLPGKSAVQITNIDYGRSQMNADTVYGYYLDVAYTNALPYLGSCVQVTGKPVEIFDASNNTPTFYGRKTLTDVLIKPATQCSLSPFVLQTNPSQQSTDTILLQGIVTQVKRPAPDIAYDFSLSLNKPYTDTLTTGGTPQQINATIIAPGNEEVAARLLSSVGKKISVSGYFQWGYAETTYFVIVAIND